MPRTPLSRLASVAVAFAITGCWQVQSGARPRRLADEEIAAVLLAASNTTISYARLVQARTQNEAVREYAARMIMDCTSLNALANTIFTRIDLPLVDNDASLAFRDVSDDQRDALRPLTGHPFDSAYVASEVKHHTNVLAALDTVLIPAARNAQLKELSVDFRSAVSAHLEHAQRLRAEIGRTMIAGTAPRARASQPLDLLDSLILASAKIAAGVPTTAQMTRAALRAQPGSSSGSVGAWGPGWGDVFFGAGYQQRTRYTTLADGSVSGGFGVGNSRKYVGGEVVVSSMSTLRQPFGQNGSISLKVHRVLPRGYGVAVGFENAMSWGGTDGGSSLYGVASHTWQLRRDANSALGSLAWNVGVGNHRYLSEYAIAAGSDGVNVFGSAGLRVHERATFIGDWAGQDLSLALSLVPFRWSPVVFSVGMADVTGTAGDGARLILGAGMGFKARILDPRGRTRARGETH